MIIGLTGLKQSGKSTVAKYLEQNFGFKRINFKDAMIEEIKQFFPDFLASEASRYNVSIEQLFDQKPGSIRQFMQNFGTELKRQHDQDYWIKKWCERLWKVENVVVDDVRFLNEADIIKRLGGKIIKIVKDGQESIDLHSSETEMSKITYNNVIIAEIGKPEFLEQEIKKYVEMQKLQSPIPSNS